MSTEPQFAVTNLEGILTVLLASDAFFDQLRRSQVIRSLPSFASVDGSNRLQSLEAVSVLRAVIIQRQIVLNLQKSGHQECFEHEHLHPKYDEHQPGKLILLYPTKLHAQYRERNLYITNTGFPPTQYPNLGSFVDRALRNMPRRMLMHSSPLGVGCVQRPPEATYQDSFRAGTYLTLGQQGRVSSEWNGVDARDRVDFYIADVGWGVEIIRQATNSPLTEHLGRFGPRGRYANWSMNGWVVLDFHTSAPT